jgi:hypothetical protein
VNVHAKSRLILETCGHSGQEPGGACQDRGAGHPLHCAGGHDDEGQGAEMPGAERKWGATLGATGTNDFPIVWMYPDSRQGRARGHGLI